MDALKRISCHNFIVENGYAWFSNWFFNGFFRVELNTGKTDFWGSFYGEKIFQKNIHLDMFLKDRELYFCPRRGQHVHIYNFNTQRMDSVKIKISSDPFYATKEVVYGEDCIFFIPEQAVYPIKKLELHSRRVTEIQQTSEIHGKYLSAYRETFPAPLLIEKYQIERGHQFFWRQMSGKEWYGFLPTGRQLLRYTEGTDKIERIPLRVVNEERLERYLYEVRTELLKEGIIFEGSLGLREFLKGMQSVEARTRDFPADKNCVGKHIWKAIRESV